MGEQLIPRSKRAVIWCVIAIALLTAFDLGTKAWALGALSEPRPELDTPACEHDFAGHVPVQRFRTAPIVLIEGYLEFRYAENCAAAFSMLKDTPLLFRRVLFSLAAVLAIIMLMWMFIKGHGARWFAWSVPFILSGALGNLIDRLRLGYVVDFIRFHLRSGFEWPTFNVADAAITIGVIMLLIDGLTSQAQRKRGEPV
ncbi:MAG: signal peptidase II [Myxococcales bacterium]|nr:signal peptidase II [Myxococcales bacterium]